MFKFKTVALAAVAVAVLAGCEFAADWTKIRVGTEGAYKPFNYTDANGELQGFDVDIAKALCEEMKADRNKSRVTFYYLVAKHLGLLGSL